MLETKEAFATLNTPEVIEERNRLVAARLGKEMNYGPEKMQELFTKLAGFSADITQQRMIEYLYAKIWMTKPKFTREDIHKVIMHAHEEAFDWYQQNNPDVWLESGNG